MGVVAPVDKSLGQRAGAERMVSDESEGLRVLFRAREERRGLRTADNPLDADPGNKGIGG